MSLPNRVEAALDHLEALEKTFLKERSAAPNPLAGWTCHDPALNAVALALAHALDDDANRLGEPAYHNRHHVAETVTAMALLCAEARRLGLVSAELATLGVLAMLGHDLGHDGSLGLGGALEQRAAERVEALAATLPAADRAVLRAVIHATEAGRVPQNLARARASGAQPQDILAAIANEADVLASLLPELGWTLSHLLATEWCPWDAPRAALVTSFARRHSFLTAYATPTPAGCALGLHTSIARQLAALDPALDRLPHAEAMAIHRSRLASLSAPPAVP